MDEDLNYSNAEQVDGFPTQGEDRQRRIPIERSVEVDGLAEAVEHRRSIFMASLFENPNPPPLDLDITAASMNAEFTRQSSGPSLETILVCQVIQF